MTKDTPWKVLLVFALPMILSGLLQQAYNLADSLVVGNFATLANGGISGEDAVAAVGASLPVINLYISLGNGAGIGAGVLIAQLFGAKRYSPVKTSAYTALISVAILSVALMLIGSVFSVPLARLMNTPENVLSPAADYLRICMYAMPFLFIYNVCNSIFNALGDSKKPLYFLLFSSLLNLILNYIFVKHLSMAVRGVAWATFIAEGVASIVSITVLLRKIHSIKSGEGEEPVRWFDGARLRAMLRVSIPSMLQFSIVSVGAVLVQWLANSFGSLYVAGYSIGVRIQNIIMVGINMTGTAYSNFSAQNIGARDLKRPIVGLKVTMGFMLVYSAAMLAIVYALGVNMIGVFISDPSQQTLSAGLSYLQVTVWGLPFFSVFNALNGLARGAGFMRAFTLATLADLFVRVVCAYALANWLGSSAIAYAVAIGWGAGFVVSVLFHRTGKWKTVRAID